MNNLKIPVWLISVCIFVFIGIILEQLYYSKLPVDLWGLKLNQETPAPNQGISIIASDSSPSGSNVYQDTVVAEFKSLLFFQAYGDATRNGTVGNAGIELELSIDGKNCGTNQSFEGEAAHVEFFAAVTCMKVLEKGSYRLEAKRIDHQGINQPGDFAASFVMIKMEVN